MEIHALRLQLTECDLADLAQRALRDQDQLSDVQIRITPEGVVVSGIFQLMLRVKFETLWSLNVQSGSLAVTLSELRAGGFGAGMLKGVLMGMVQSEIEREHGVSVEGETIRVDIDQVLAARGLVVLCNLVRVECSSGSVAFLSDRAAGTEPKAA
jgi:hypothetical protein